jgi:hypothetical protein
LLKDVLVTLLLLLLHAIALAPLLLLSGLRRLLRLGSPPSCTEPGLEYFEGTVTHTRLSPVFHSFTYPVRGGWRAAAQCGSLLSTCSRSSPAAAPLTGSQRIGRLGRTARVVQPAKGLASRAARAAA